MANQRIVLGYKRHHAIQQRSGRWHFHFCQWTGSCHWSESENGREWAKIGASVKWQQTLRYREQIATYITLMEEHAHGETGACNASRLLVDTNVRFQPRGSSTSPAILPDLRFVYSL